MLYKLVTYVGDECVAIDFFPTHEKAEEEGENNLELFADSYLIIEVDEHGEEVK